MHSFQDYLCFPQLNLHILWAFFLVLLNINQAKSSAEKTFCQL